MANDLSFKAVWYFSGFVLISIALSMTSFICCGVQSLSVNKCNFSTPRRVLPFEKLLNDISFMSAVAFLYVCGRRVA